MLSNWYTTIEHFGLDVRQVSREPLKLVANLISKLARMAQHQGTNSLIFGLKLMQRRQHEDSSFAHARFGLAEHIHA